MAATWTDPDLGLFKYDKDSDAWVARVSVPAFTPFSWEQDEPDETCELRIETESQDEKPSADTVALAKKVLKAQKDLVPKVTKALWDDFNGRGPDSGMWWHGDMDQVAENFGYGDRPAPKGPDDLLGVMCLCSITVHREVDGYDNGPLVELGFSALFEEEHGVGILTDGESILGAGYMIDVLPYGVDED